MDQYQSLFRRQPATEPKNLFQLIRDENPSKRAEFTHFRHCYNMAQQYLLAFILPVGHTWSVPTQTGSRQRGIFAQS